MLIKESIVKYKVIGKGKPEALDTAELSFSYLKDFFWKKAEKGEADLEVENFFVISLNRKNFPIACKIITVGTVSASLVHPREVFKEAVRNSASSIIIAHNHPSGDVTPSHADIQVTRSIREASKIMDIDLLDHIILGDDNFYSFCGSGLI